MTSKDVFVTPEHLAEQLGVSQKTLNKWRWEGRGPEYVKFGSCVRYSKVAVQDFISASVVVRETAQ